MNRSEYRTALDLADRFCHLAAARGGMFMLRSGNRMAALILHYLGEHETSRKRIEQVTTDTAASARRFASVSRFVLDQGVSSDSLLARILWLQGFPDQATRTAQSAVEQAASAHHKLTLCHALAQAACPIALWTGDLPSADRFVTMLLDEASRDALEGWVARGRCFRGVLLVRSKAFKAGAACLSDALHDLRAAGSMAEYPAFLSALARGLAAAGHVAQAKATIDEAIKRSDETEERWCLPELLRVNGETLLALDSADRNAAEEQFRLSLDWARRQGALSWELRTAASLLRMRRDRDGCSESRDILASVYGRFTEGFETDDVRAAKLLLDSLT
jgi:hypothetical protein